MGFPKGGKGGGGGFAPEQEQVRKAQDAHFWEIQDKNEQEDAARGAPPRKGGFRLRQEEEELFTKLRNHTAGIDFKKYDSVRVDSSGKAASRIPSCQTFDEIFIIFKCLPSWLRENVKRCGYLAPTPVQKHAVPAALVGRDIMVCAQTGSGKTAAFLLPLIAALDPKKGCEYGGHTFKGAAAPLGVVMSPTRELCEQIHVEARKLTFNSPYRPIVIVGGMSAWQQIRELARGVDLLTATPGRLQDFVDRGIISLKNVEFCVLDEADRMLDMGFEPAVRKLVLRSDMPSSESRQTMMFSATFQPEIQGMAQDFLFEYVWLGVGRVGGANESVTQTIVQIKNSEKGQALIKIMGEDVHGAPLNDGELVPLTMVFCGMKKSCNWIVEKLRSSGVSAGCINGDMEQWERSQTLKEFKSGTIRALVATDVAARGLDIPAVARVINYDLPGNIDDYVHRIGRTGRIGNRGLAIGFFVLESEDGRDQAGRPMDMHNINLAPQLVETLASANAEVPEWLEQVAGVRAEQLREQGGAGQRAVSKDARRERNRASRARRARSADARYHG